MWVHGVETPSRVASQRLYFHFLSTNARYIRQGDLNALYARRFRLIRASAHLAPIARLYSAFRVTTAPLRALSRFTFAFAFPSRLSSARPVLSLYDPLVRLPLSFQLTLAIYLVCLYIFPYSTTQQRFFASLPLRLSAWEHLP